MFHSAMPGEVEALFQAQNTDTLSNEIEIQHGTRMRQRMNSSISEGARCQASWSLTRSEPRVVPSANVCYATELQNEVVVTCS